MQTRERFKEISIDGSSIRNTRIAEQESKDRGEGSPQDQDSEEQCNFVSIEALHEVGDDVTRVRGFTPGHYADYDDLDRQISRSGRENAVEDRARNHAGRFADFISDVADIVVTDVVIHGNAHGPTES